MSRTFRTFICLLGALLAVGVLGAASASAAPPVKADPPLCGGVQVLSPDSKSCVDQSPQSRIINPFMTCGDYALQGVFDIPRTDSRYREFLDRDRDGIACEKAGEGTVPNTSTSATPAPANCRRDEFLDRRLNRCVVIIRDPRRPSTSTETREIVNGDCTTVITTTTNYDRSLREWNDVATRYRELRVLNLVQRRELDTAYRNRTRDFDLYNRDRQVLSSTNTTCKQPVPAPVTVVAAPPPVVYQAPRQIIQAPSGGIETGDGSSR